MPNQPLNPMTLLRAAHASHTGQLFLVDLHPPHGITELIRDTQIETCTTQHRLAFWFTRNSYRPLTHPNATATEILLTATRFTARNVPILRGDIVITGIDANGQPATLTHLQTHLITRSMCTTREQHILARRFSHDTRVQRRRARAEHAHRATQLPFRN